MSEPLGLDRVREALELVFIAMVLMPSQYQRSKRPMDHYIAFAKGLELTSLKKSVPFSTSLTEVSPAQSGLGLGFGAAGLVSIKGLNHLLERERISKFQESPSSVWPTVYRMFLWPGRTTLQPVKIKRRQPSCLRKKPILAPSFCILATPVIPEVLS